MEWRNGFLEVNRNQIILYASAIVIGVLLAFIPFTYMVPQVFLGIICILHAVFVLAIYTELSRIIEWFEGFDKLVYINSDYSSRMRLLFRVISLIGNNLLYFAFIMFVPWIIIHNQYFLEFVFITYFILIYSLINLVASLILLIGMSFVKDKLLSLLSLLFTESLIITFIFSRLKQVFSLDFIIPSILLAVSLFLLTIVYRGWSKWI